MVSEGGTMIVVKSLNLLLLIVSLFGCANQLRGPARSESIAAKERNEQQKNSPLPTITYRPGG
jgi:hypothetical protein